MSGQGCPFDGLRCTGGMDCRLGLKWSDTTCQKKRADQRHRARLDAGMEAYNASQTHAHNLRTRGWSELAPNERTRWADKAAGKVIVGGEKPAAISQAEVERDIALADLKAVRDILDPERIRVTAEQPRRPPVDDLDVMRDVYMTREQRAAYERMAKDAERYRYVKEYGGLPLVEVGLDHWEPPSDLDAAIDAAIAAADGDAGGDHAVEWECCRHLGAENEYSNWMPCPPEMLDYVRASAASGGHLLRKKVK